jgi:hypothetical protein
MYNKTKSLLSLLLRKKTKKRISFVTHYKIFTNYLFYTKALKLYKDPYKDP